MKFPDEALLRRLFPDCWRQPDLDYALSDAMERWEQLMEVPMLEAYFMGYCAACGDVEVIINGCAPKSARIIESYARSVLSKMVVPPKVQFSRITPWLRAFYKNTKELVL